MNNLKLGKLSEEFNIYAMMLEELEKVVFMHDTDLLVRIDWSDLNDGWEVLVYRETTRDNIWLFEELDRAIVKGEAIDAVLFFNKSITPPSLFIPDTPFSLYISIILCPNEVLNIEDSVSVTTFHPNSTKTSDPTLKKYGESLSRSSNENIVKLTVHSLAAFKVPSYLVEIDLIPEIGL